MRKISIFIESIIRTIMWAVMIFLLGGLIGMILVSIVEMYKMAFGRLF